jgi:hypothetical protein
MRDDLTHYARLSDLDLTTEEIAARPPSEIRPWTADDVARLTAVRAVFNIDRFTKLAPLSMRLGTWWYRTREWFAVKVLRVEVHGDE